jgi:hypothetical protein
VTGAVRPVETRTPGSPRPTATARGRTPDLFAAKTGFDPRRLATPYLYFRVRPRRIQAWREANELDGRELMRDGEWLVAD